LAWLDNHEPDGQRLISENKTELVSLLSKSKESLRTFGIRRFGLFGSFARGEQNHDSDVDFLVEFESGKKTYENFIHLSFFLEDLIGRRVELVTPEGLSPYIGPRILQEVEYVSFAD
jgi:uncharacterized protein